MDISGHALRMLRLASELRTAHGVNVDFLGRGRWQDTVTRAGFRVVNAADLDWTNLQRWLSQPDRVVAHSIIDLFRQMHADDTHVLARIKPDLVLVDNRWTLAAAARTMEIPCVVVSNITTTWMLSELTPRREFHTQWRTLRLLTSLMRVALEKPERVAALDEGDVLLLESPLIVERSGAPASVLERCVGPIFHDGDAARGEDVYAGSEIVVAPGGTGDAETFARCAVELDSLGWRTTFVGRWPTNIEHAKGVGVVDLLSSEVIAAARLAVVAGGIGTLYKCLAAGVPIVVHGKLPEHGANAALFEAAGCALLASDPVASAVEILSSSHRLLPERVYVTAAGVDGSSRLAAQLVRAVY